MHVALLTHFPGKGGSTYLLKQVAEALGERGHTCTTIVGSDDKEPIISGYHVVSGKGRVERRSAYLKLLEKEEPQVVLRISGVEEFDWLRFTPLPRVSHCSSFEDHEYHSIPHLVHSTYGYTELWTGNTPDMEDLLADACGAPIPFQLLPYRIAETFTSLPAPRPEESPSDSIRIAYVGRLEAFQKRVRRLPDIIRQTHEYEPGVHWEILGDGPECEFLIRQLSRHHLQECVTFHKWMSPTGIVQTLNSCQVFFLCSRWEGLPIAMVESMLCGLAPVVPDLSAGVSYLIDSSAGWTYEPNTVGGAVRAVVQAIRSPDLPSRRIGAWSAAHQMTSPVVVSRQLDELFSRMQHLAHNDRVETDLRIAPVRSLAFRKLPSALAHRAARRFRTLLP